MYPSQTLGCENCGKDFSITQYEIDILDKLSPKIGSQVYHLPTPSQCPDCRQQLRLSFFNERTLFKRNSDFSNEPMVSMYSLDKPNKVYSQKEWWGDGFDAKNFGVPYDETRSFFEQFYQMDRQVPRISLINVNCQNSDFNNYLENSKNCYLSFSTQESEDCEYISASISIKKSFDCWWSSAIENSYQIFNCSDMYHCFYCMGCTDGSELYFCEECYNCHNCVFCYGLYNKNYCIFNKEYSKEEYEQKLKELNFFTSENIPEYKKLFTEFCQKIPCKYTHEERNENAIGDYIYESKNAINSFGVIKVEHTLWLYEGGRIKDVYDCYNIYDGQGHTVGSSTVVYGTKVYFSRDIYNSSDIFYSMHLYNCKFCFGCSGLKNKQYYIFNTQFSEDEYFKVVESIVQNMQTSGEWGQFFPAYISDFGYNETVAQEYYPLTREEVLNPQSLRDSSFDKGAQKNLLSLKEDAGKAGGFIHGPKYNWSDYVPPLPKVEKIIPASKLPKSIKEVPDDILNWAIDPAETEFTPFRITKSELDFYRQNNIPIPQKNPLQRHLERMENRNPRKFFDVKCSECKKDIFTTYLPKKQRKIVCGECYKKVTL